MSGVGGGWINWVALTGLMMSALCFLIFLVVRHFVSGVMLVLITTSLAFLLILLGVASGMARSDFGLEIVLPYALLALAIAGAWLVVMKARGRKG